MVTSVPAYRPTSAVLASEVQSERTGGSGARLRKCRSSGTVLGFSESVFSPQTWGDTSELTDLLWRSNKDF